MAPDSKGTVYLESLDFGLLRTPLVLLTSGIGIKDPVKFSEDTEGPTFWGRKDVVGSNGKVEDPRGVSGGDEGVRLFSSVSTSFSSVTDLRVRTNYASDSRPEFTVQGNFLTVPEPEGSLHPTTSTQNCIITPRIKYSDHLKVSFDLLSNYSPKLSFTTIEITPLL